MRVAVRTKTLQRLTDEEVIYILDTQLPEILERNPRLEPLIYYAFSKVFTRKEEIAAIVAKWNENLGDIRQLRQEVSQRFDEADQRFDEVDQHLTHVDQRFEQVDQRFDQVDQRFEQVDQRFDQVDQRFDQVDQRFDQVDQRFEQVDQQFIAVRQEIAEQGTQLRQEMRDLSYWVQTVVGGFQTRAGENLEEMVAGMLRFALERPDISAEKLRLRQKVKDAQGLIGPAGRSYEVDILAEDGIRLVLEVKSVCEFEDADRLFDKVTLIHSLNPHLQVVGVMIVLEAKEEAVERLDYYGIRLVGGKRDRERRRQRDAYKQRSK